MGWVAFGLLVASLAGFLCGLLLAAWALCEFNVDISRAQPAIPAPPKASEK